MRVSVSIPPIFVSGILLLPIVLSAFFRGAPGATVVVACAGVQFVLLPVTKVAWQGNYALYFIQTIWVTALSLGIASFAFDPANEDLAGGASFAGILACTLSLLGNKYIESEQERTFLA